MNLNLTERIFDGMLDGTADGPIRVLLPQGFMTAFETTLAKDATFVCRADIGTQMRRREDGARVIYSFGEGGPVMRLVSTKGPIVIDNAAAPWEEAMANAMLRPKRPTLRAQAFADVHFPS